MLQRERLARCSQSTPPTAIPTGPHIDTRAHTGENTKQALDNRWLLQRLGCPLSRKMTNDRDTGDCSRRLSPRTCQVWR